MRRSSITIVLVVVFTASVGYVAGVAARGRGPREARAPRDRAATRSRRRRSAASCS
jgi:hypothetical protein